MYNAVLIGKDRWGVGILEDHAFRPLNSNEVVEVCNKLNDLENGGSKVPRKVIYEHVVCDRADEVDKNGNMSSAESLKALDGQENIPVTLFFNGHAIGTAKTKFDRVTKELFSTIETTDNYVLSEMKAAPQYAIEEWHKEDNARVITKVKLLSIGIVNRHSLHNIPSIK